MPEGSDRQDATSAGQGWTPFGAKAFIWSVATIVAGGILASIAIVYLPLEESGEAGTNNEASEDVSGDKLEEDAARIGDTVRDEYAFAWTLEQFTCGLQTSDVREELTLSQDARGEICKAQAHVTNRSDSARSPFSNPGRYRLLIRDRSFSAWETAGDAFGRDLFPDSGADASIYFDVPPGSDPTVLILNEDPIDGGASFSLAE